MLTDSDKLDLILQLQKAICRKLDIEVVYIDKVPQSEIDKLNQSNAALAQAVQNQNPPK